MPSALFHSSTAKASHQSAAAVRRSLPSAQHNSTSSSDTLSDLVFKFERLDRLSGKQNTARAPHKLRLQQPSTTFLTPQTKVAAANGPSLQETKKANNPVVSSELRNAPTSTGKEKPITECASQVFTSTIAARCRLFKDKTALVGVGDDCSAKSTQKDGHGKLISKTGSSQTPPSRNLDHMSNRKATFQSKNCDEALGTTQCCDQPDVPLSAVVCESHNFCENPSPEPPTSLLFDKSSPCIKTYDLSEKHTDDASENMSGADNLHEEPAELTGSGESECYTKSIHTEMRQEQNKEDRRNDTSASNCPLSSMASTPVQTQAQGTECASDRRLHNRQGRKSTGFPRCCEPGTEARSNFGWYPGGKFCQEPVVTTQPAAPSSVAKSDKRFSMKLPSRLKDTISLFESLNCRNTESSKRKDVRRMPGRNQSEQPQSCDVLKTMDGASENRLRVSLRYRQALADTTFRKSVRKFCTGESSLPNRPVPASSPEPQHHDAVPYSWRSTHGHTWPGYKRGYIRVCVHNTCFTCEPEKNDFSTECSNNYPLVKTFTTADERGGETGGHLQSGKYFAHNRGTVMTSAGCLLEHPTPVRGVETARIKTLCRNQAARLRLHTYTE